MKGIPSTNPTPEAKNSAGQDATDLKADDSRNWNFDGVPDSELAACCVWEYARESLTLQRLYWFAQWWWESRPYRPNPSGDGMVENTPEVRDLAKKLLESVRKNTGFDIEDFRKGFWKNNITAVYGSTSRVPYNVYRCLEMLGIVKETPWQAIRDEEKLFLVETQAKAIRCASANDIRELLRPPNKANVDSALANEGGLISQMFRDYESLPSARVGTGWTVAAFVIDWDSYTKGEIKEALCKWVEDNQPKGLPHVTTQGRSLKEPRADLTRLAVMRLLHWYTFNELYGPHSRAATIEELRKCKQFTGAKWQDSAKWYDARREAGNVFHEILPFLPSTEKPSSWPTKGGQSK